MNEMNIVEAEINMIYMLTTIYKLDVIIGIPVKAYLNSKKKTIFLNSSIRSLPYEHEYGVVHKNKPHYLSCLNWRTLYKRYVELDDGIYKIYNTELKEIGHIQVVDLSIVSGKINHVRITQNGAKKRKRRSNDGGESRKFGTDDRGDPPSYDILFN